jgi:hypothetical protein
MNKITIIIVVALWIFCVVYLKLAWSYDFPYANYAMAGSWIASVLLLICIIIYIKKHKSK